MNQGRNQRTPPRADLRIIDAGAAFEAERRIAWLRLAVVAGGTAIFPFVASGRSASPRICYALLGVGWFYAVALVWLERHRRHSALFSGVCTTCADSAMTLAWLWSTGGIDSPWFVALYPALASISLRHPPRVSSAAAAVYALACLGMAVFAGELRSRAPELVLRIFFLFPVAAFGAVVARERMMSLKSRLRLLDMTQEVAQVGSWEWSIDDDVLEWSEQLRRIIGLPPGAEPTIQAYMAAIPPEDRERVAKIITDARNDLLPFQFDHRIVGPEGMTRWLHCRGRVIVGSDGRALEMIGSAQDVTERHEMQAQLVFTGKLASLGTLASGVAHEINNPLAYVANNLEIIDRVAQAPIDDMAARELREAVEAARHGTSRVRDIILGLRTFSRMNDESRGPVDLARVADSAIAMVAHEVERRARLVRDYERVPCVVGNASHLSQVLVNLLVNAAQAITRGTVAENAICVRLFSRRDGRVVLEVSDTGAGIHPDHLDKIFDPFFTTKPTGVGTGLGLSICHGIVRDLGGELYVETAPGEGTTFRVILAGTDAVPEGAAGPPSTRDSGELRRGRILVVDDETRYATSLRLLLSNEYEVTMSTSGQRALELLDAGERFNVILCDLMMPGMTGMDLHARLEKMSPALAARMIFLTGGATSDEAHDFLQRPDIRHLVKPLEYPTLLSVIEAVMEASANAAA